MKRERVTERVVKDIKKNAKVGASEGALKVVQDVLKVSEDYLYLGYKLMRFSDGEWRPLPIEYEVYSDKPRDTNQGN